MGSKLLLASVGFSQAQIQHDTFPLHLLLLVSFFSAIRGHVGRILPNPQFKYLPQRDNFDASFRETVLMHVPSYNFASDASLKGSSYWRLLKKVWFHSTMPGSYNLVMFCYFQRSNVGGHTLGGSSYVTLGLRRPTSTVKATINLPCGSPSNFWRASVHQARLKNSARTYNWVF